MIASGSNSMVSDDLAVPFSRGTDFWLPVGMVLGAKVQALEVVTNTGGGKREVKWRRVQCELPESNRSGAQYWRQPTFKFADTVAESFQLKELFEKHMKDAFSE